MLSVLNDTLTAIQQGNGDGIRIAILDSGVDNTHPQFAKAQFDNLLEITSRGGKISVAENTSTDEFGHGTAVAGIIHQSAPKAILGSIKILGGFNQSRADIVKAGVREAAIRGYDIVHCSFGVPASNRDILTYKSWIDALYLKNIHIVAAGANSHFTDQEWPSHFSSVISVGSQDIPLSEFRHTPGSLIQLSAQGRERNACWLNHQTKDVNGSSFAAPRVTAILARLLSTRGALCPLYAKHLILEHAKSNQGVTKE